MYNLNFKFMEKYYLCSVQSKTNASQNETFLVPADEVSEFITASLHPDSVIILTHFSMFDLKLSSDDEK